MAGPAENCDWDRGEQWWRSESGGGWDGVGRHADGETRTW